MTIDLVASRYGQRPSSLLGLPLMSPLALDFDSAIAMRAVLEEKRAHDEAREQSAGEPGMREIDAENLETEVPHVKGMMSF
jgi:hypothetical protein